MRWMRRFDKASVPRKQPPGCRLGRGVYEVVAASLGLIMKSLVEYRIGDISKLAVAGLGHVAEQLKRICAAHPVAVCDESLRLLDRRVTPDEAG